MKRLTVHGDALLEARIATSLEAMAEEVATECRASLRPTLLLFGGYGRGEGGVERGPDGPRPHNNFDLLLLTLGATGRERRRLEDRLTPRLAAIGARLGVGVDLSVHPRRALTRGRPSVMWHDLAGGHRVLLGDGSFLSRCTHLRTAPVVDMHRLLVNRGSLLLINRALLDDGGDHPAVRRTVIKHRAKAILGYGDALLHSRDAYHWSYLEKARRIDALPGVDPGFAALHRTALEFRLDPDYSRPPRSIVELDDVALLARLAPVHLEFVSRWAGEPGLTWADLPDRLADLLRRDRRRHPLEALRAAVHTCVSRQGLRGGILRRSDRLSLAFPLLAYPDRFVDAPRRLLGLLRTGNGEREARSAFLSLWGHHGDRKMAQALPDTPSSDTARTETTPLSLETAA